MPTQVVVSGLPRWLCHAHPGGCVIPTQVVVSCPPRWLCQAYPGGCVMPTQVVVSCPPRWLCHAHPGGCVMPTQVVVSCPHRWLCHAHPGGCNGAVNTGSGATLTSFYCPPLAIARSCLSATHSSHQLVSQATVTKNSMFENVLKLKLCFSNKFYSFLLIVFQFSFKFLLNLIL